MKKDPAQLSDRQLRSLLKGLREDVAAPAGFRQGVLKRLQAEGLLARPPKATWQPRLSFWTLRPARLGLALGGALALAFVWMGLDRSAVPPMAQPQTLSESSAAQPATAAPRQAKPAGHMAQARLLKPSVAVKLVNVAPVVASVEAPDVVAPASAVGRSDASYLQESLQVGSTDGKPQVVLVKPTPTPLTKALGALSEVRNNVIRASQGQTALVIFKVRQSGRVRVEIINRLGALVAVLQDGDMGVGEQTLRWSGASDQGGMAASGLYLVRISTPDYVANHKVLLIK